MSLVFLADEEKMPWEEVKVTLYMVALLLLVTIGLWWELLIFIMTIRFFRRFKLSKKVFAWFLLLINLSLSWRIFYLLVIVYSHRPYHWQMAFQVWFVTFLDNLNLIFLILAGTVNVYNWIRFTLSLRVYDQRTKKKHKFWLSTINFCTPIVIVFITAVYFTYFIVGCTVRIEGDGLYYVSFAMNTLFFLSLAISFFSAEWYLKSQLRLWNEEVEKKSRHKITFAAQAIAIPFCL